MIKRGYPGDIPFIISKSIKLKVMKRSSRAFLTCLLLLLFSLPFLLVWKNYSSLGIVGLAFSLGFLFRALKYRKEEKFLEDDEEE